MECCNYGTCSCVLQCDLHSKFLRSAVASVCLLSRCSEQGWPYMHTSYACLRITHDRTCVAYALRCNVQLSVSPTFLHMRTCVPFARPRTRAYMFLLMRIICVLHSFYIRATCVLHAFCMRSTCVLHAFNMRSTCVLHVFYMRSTCVLHAFYMRFTCAQHAFSMRSSCVLHAFQLRSTCVLYVFLCVLYVCAKHCC